ncbi:hypothetical protein ACER0C_001162 [Sarotherodon galilaeus]
MALQQFVCCFTVLIISLCKACGSRAVKSSSITGGQHATPGSWPWYAEVNSLFGGSLISDQWVLTTASITLFDFSSIEVYLGRHSKSGSNPNEVNRTVVNITCHPEFNSSTRENDICLLKLSAPVNFTDYIQPICLASENSTFDNETSSWVIGFGDDDDGSFTKTLKEAKVPIMGNNKCKCIYQGSYTKITENMNCAGDEDSFWLQSGVLSVSACGAFPSVFTRVSQYQKWISDKVTGTPTGSVTFTSPDSSTSPTTSPDM